METNIRLDYDKISKINDLGNIVNQYISGVIKERNISIEKNNSIDIITDDNKAEFDLTWLQKIDSKKDVYEYMSNIQSWTGYVSDIEEDNFTAKLIDKKDPTTYEIATFSKEDVSDGDLNLLKPGAVFYWSIGYATNKGQRIKQSLIRFRRSGNISVQVFDQAMDRAEELNQNLTWD